MWRLSLGHAMPWREDEGGELRLTIAPWQVKGSTTTASDVRFEDTTFAGSAPIKLLYRFNTYPLTYSEPLGSRGADDWHWRLGGTLAIRDARIRLAQGAQREEFKNWGPVPLLWLSASRRLGSAWSVSAEADAFPAPGGGGLVDALVKLQWEPDARWSLWSGWRYQAGGAEDRNFYNAIRQQAWVLGLRLTP